MHEIFKPRENMVRFFGDMYFCYDDDGNYICDGGPSIIHSAGRCWEFYISGIGTHRLDGPAKSNGAWFINNKNITKEIYTFAKENSIDLDNLSDADKVMIALKFG